MSAGLLWDTGYPEYELSNGITIPGHDLCAFIHHTPLQVIVVSLIDGKIKRRVKFGYTCGYPFLYSVTDSLIIKIKTYSSHLIDALTGQVSAHSFPIANPIGWSFLLDRMIVMNDKEIQVVGFAPDLLLQ